MDRWLRVLATGVVALGLRAQAPVYTEVARSGFEMKGNAFSRATLELDMDAVRRVLARPGAPGEEALVKVLKGMKDGRIRFRIRQGWEVDVSGSQRRAFNERVAREVWRPLPPVLKPSLERFLTHSERSVNLGQHWEHEALGGGRMRSRYLEEPWKVRSDPNMAALFLGMYLEGPEETPGTRVDFRRGLSERLARIPPIHP